MAPKSSPCPTSVPPADLVPAIDILDEKHKPGDFVNVIGIVQKVLSPMLTRAGQWKADVEIFDLSTQYDPELKLTYTVFHKSESMLPDIQCGDVIVLQRVKVQSYSFRPSLLHNLQTSVFFFAAEKLPPLPGDPTPALKTTPLNPKRSLSGAHLRYVPVFFHEIDKGRLPTVEEFNSVKVQTVSIKDKFLELKDVKDMVFCDVKVNIVKEPYDSGDKITLWVSDYTENQNFFNFAFDPLAITEGEHQDHDEYGYKVHSTSGTGTSSSTLAGPYGQRSLQITCWGYHADAIRSYKLGIGAWVHIKNVHIKFGHNGGNLEGFLREDDNAREKVRIYPLDPHGNAKGLDPQLKEALRRKRDYEKAKKHALAAVAEAAHAGQKRRASTAVGHDDQNTSKQRRKQRREKERNEKVAAEILPEENNDDAPTTALNPAVKHEHHEIPLSMVSEITGPKYIQVECEGQEITLQLPFVNTFYRGNFRITDFKPDRLEDFAAPVKSKDEFAALSDNDSESESERSDPGSNREADVDASFEWRFALRLEDAEGVCQDKRSFWALVDNPSAQYLTNMDAADLNRDASLAEQLRETMFLLWGNLEERKREVLEKRASAVARAKNCEPPDSSFEGSLSTAVKPDAVSNLPFGCCITEYGVKVKEADDSKAYAGLGYRWERVYRLDRTRIVKD